jgi:hypothetical protein
MHEAALQGPVQSIAIAYADQSGRGRSCRAGWRALGTATWGPTDALNGLNAQRWRLYER